MTFSIVAKCAKTGQFGIAAATAMPAVGKLLTHAFTGVGAVATQARLNPYLGVDGLDLLRQGLSADEVVERLKHRDPRADLRQFAVVDASGGRAAWTGSGCPDWSGHHLDDGFTVQGNRLAGPHVLRAAAETFKQMADSPLDKRLVEALTAGDQAGGDTKGERSATVYVVDTEEYPLWDIRVDEHERPVEELRRLHDVFSRDLLPQILKMPTRANPAGEFGEDVA
ncbi:DUF1028 domain-containing protein [Chelativorans sp. YIM 93263]|uniref:DUF1028 domain-containing protein n=1 Tax=Chelativorans sp. YIM 93263 TaxID=2906648 RepID=UPI0023783786|nr:DUF1028 domain-containing protein [Chelativorans sp. YIM 93263]